MLKLRQNIEFSGGATANYIDLFDVTDFGGELRAIGSANVYGTHGAYGDGPGVKMYLVGQNFAYIGNGKAVDNDNKQLYKQTKLLRQTQLKYSLLVLTIEVTLELAMHSLLIKKLDKYNLTQQT